jgi:regulator of protease activity HflC (stomatin/prohibitin superfamily)
MGRGKALVVLFIGLVLFAFIAILPGVGAWTIVGAGHVGVVTKFGAVDRVVNPGFVLKLPLIEAVSSMETRTQKEQIDTLAASKDLQQVKSTIAINFHLIGAKAVHVYQNIGEDYTQRIVAPAVQETFKSTTSQFTASNLIVQREQVKKIAYTELKTRLGKYDIVVDDLNIVNFAFSPEFTAAIEQKTVAEQNKERAQIEAQTALIQAKGQADAQKTLKDSQSLTSEYLQFLAIQKWDGKMPSSTNGVPFIQLPTK